jgi:hypothetical protein
VLKGDAVLYDLGASDELSLLRRLDLVLRGRGETVGGFQVSPRLFRYLGIDSEDSERVDQTLGYEDEDLLLVERGEILLAEEDAVGDLVGVENRPPARDAPDNPDPVVFARREVDVTRALKVAD